MTIVQYIFWALVLTVVAILGYYSAKNRERIKEFYNEVRQEMTKVNWPSQQETINSTVLVGVTVIIVSIGVAAIDSVYSAILKIVY